MMTSFHHLPLALCALCLSASTLASPMAASLAERAYRAGNPKLADASALFVSASQVQASRQSLQEAAGTATYLLPSDTTTFRRPSASAISNIANVASSEPLSESYPISSFAACSESSTASVSSVSASASQSTTKTTTSYTANNTKGPATWTLVPVTVGPPSSAVPSASAQASSSGSASASSVASSSSNAPTSTPLPPFYIGGNSYYLHTYSDKPRRQVLDAMQAVGMKVVRIFISHVYANNKGSPNIAMNDVEPWSVGVYDDTILSAVDQLMVDCQARGMKLVIALHDRYALGFWDTDAYALQYGIVSPGTSGAQRISDASAFYTTTSAKVAFDARIKHILNHKNPLMGNTRWANLDSVIQAFEPENEPMGHMNFYADWTCDRAATIKSMLPAKSGILVSTGGGITLQTSLADWAYSCPNFDIVSAHDYGTDPATTIPTLLAGQAQAKKSGKTVVFGEWGASGQSKAAVVSSFVSALGHAGIPHLVWEITLPGAGINDFEIWTNEPSWSAFTSNVKANTNGKAWSKRSEIFTPKRLRIGDSITQVHNNRLLIEENDRPTSNFTNTRRSIHKRTTRLQRAHLQAIHPTLLS